MQTKEILKKTKQYTKKIISHPHFPTGLAFLLLAIFLVTGSYASRPSRGRRLTSSPLLWAKLDGSLTDENSAGSTFAYSVGKSSSGSDYGITLKEGDNIQYGPGTAIDAGSDVYENWNPNQGTMNVWVQPNWNGGDNEAHWIWSADAGRIDTADANLVAYWKFDEGSENFAFDSSSNDNVGYLHGPALSFDGGDYVNIASNSTFDFRDVSEKPFTMIAWINESAAPSAGETIVSVGTSHYNSLSLNIDNNSKLYVVADTSGTADWEIANCSTGTITINQWNLVAFTRDTSGQYKFYINGSDAGNNFTVTNDIYLDTYSIKIGGHYALTGGWNFNGSIDEVRIYNRALSATEVGQHYAGTFADESGLAGYWNMDENTGQTVADSSGNSNDGTLGATSGSSTDDPSWVNYAPRWTDEGRFGDAVVFDGSDDEVEINDINF